MKDVDWTKWSAIGQIVGTFAIVATLAYLSVQTRQTTSALFSSTRAQMMEVELALVIESANSPYSEGMRDAVQALLPPDQELTNDQVIEAWRTYNLLAGFTRMREFAWFQYQDGLLEEGAWEGYMETLVRNMRAGIGPVLWESYRTELDPEFAAYVDARLARD